jgi:hypothetical protein
MKDIPIFDICGGMDTRLQYQQSGKILFMDDAKNIDIYGKSVRRTRGQVSKLQIAGTSVLGMSKHEVSGIFGLRAICDNGNYYRVDPATGVYTSANTGLSASAKPFFFQFNSKLVCITGYNDPFVDDGTAVTQTGFYTTYSKYGQGGISFRGRIFIWDGSLWAWSAANTTDTWVLEGDAGYKDNFNGDIIGAAIVSEYVLIFTTSDVYIMSGDSNDNFSFSHYSDIGIFSRFQITKFFRKLYVFSVGDNTGLFPIESLGDLAQLRVSEPISFRVSNSFIDIDETRINEIIVVPFESRKQIWIYVPIQNKPGMYKCWIANFENFDDSKVVSFYYREANPITCACDLNGKIYTGTSDGHIYEECVGDTFDETVIQSNAMFSPLSFGTDRIKKCRKFKANFNSYSTNRCSFMWAYDGDHFSPDEEQVDLLDIHDEYFELDADELDGSRVSAVTDWVSEIMFLQNKFNSVQFGIKTENSGEDFIFAGGTFINLTVTNKI